MDSSQHWPLGIAPQTAGERFQTQTEAMYARESERAARARFEEFTQENETMVATNIALMSAAELEKHIETLVAVQKQQMITLRALLRARRAEEILNPKNDTE